MKHRFELKTGDYSRLLILASLFDMTCDQMLSYLVMKGHTQAMRNITYRNADKFNAAFLKANVGFLLPEERNPAA